MKQQCFNPYLPGWEYTPDGEPHVFGGRVYVYGSHDRVWGIHGYVKKTESIPENELKQARKMLKLLIQGGAL